MAALSSTLKNEKGSILFISMFILMLVTIIGIAATTTTDIEVNIGGNEKRQKQAFYAAEGGAETAIELVEQNIEEAGFDEAGTDGEGQPYFEVGNVRGPLLDFYRNDPPNADSLGSPEAFFPKGYTGNEPHTNINVGGMVGIGTGGAIQAAAGYEGKGKSSAGGGSFRLYDIYSEHKGERNSEARIRVQWKHVM